MTLKAVEKQIKVDEENEISILTRSDNRITQPIIVFIHGFGCTKNSFETAFRDSSLDKFTLVAPDLPGHGNSKEKDGFSYEMPEIASLIMKAIEQLGISSFHLCGHSMGGLIGIEMAELNSELVKSFVNLEGNLTLDDCFFTKKILNYSYSEFVAKGRKLFERRLALQVDQSSKLYLKTFKQATDNALYRTAVSTVALSGDKRLIDRFISLNVPRCYVYGKRNKGIFPAEQVLLSAGVPVYYVKDAGHFMAEENPSELYKRLKTWIDEADQQLMPE